ncbi:hypothetical protein Bca52824_089696 [Brassica carinata]|uniref:Reverse transcriptase n=1 Tax=Brassica carinata TaxID=52824 RepID=A0A8X7PG75_BRACI|nr:hypothetical protein Bca52824_089696 [Brassica carinata]
MLNLIMSKVFPRWQFLSNHQSDPDGRIIFLWGHPASVKVLAQSRQSLTTEVTLPNHPPITITSIYASNLAEERIDLWAELINTQQQLSLHLKPWLVAGDFNQITHPSKHSSPTVQALSSSMIHFRDTLLQLGLFDLRYQGIFNTWSNKQPASLITKKLDCALVNYEWISAFPSSSAIFLPSKSDHTSCLLNLQTPLPIAGTKPFKFFNYLTQHPLFLTTVNDAWILAGIFSSTLADLSWKLKSLKSVLKNLNRDNFSKIQERVISANCLLKDEKTLHDKWMFLRGIEEAYFRQRSRINWLKEGDSNTSYFHRVAVVRAAINTIISFLLSNGSLITDLEEMAIHAVNNFKSILAPDVLPFCLVSVSWFQSLIPYRCSPEACLSFLVKGVLEILEQFKSKSGLAINMISSSTGLTHGSLPICYLGVPLNSKKLSLLNCEPLLNQVKTTATRCQVNTPRDYQSTIDYLINLRLSKPHKKLLLIAWQCVIYLLWTERNSRLHRRSFRSPQSLLTTLDLTKSIGFRMIFSVRRGAVSLTITKSNNES